MEEVCNNLNINLLEIDDSFIWVKAQAASLFQVSIRDTEIFFDNYQDSKG